MLEKSFSLACDFISLFFFLAHVSFEEKLGRKTHKLTGVYIFCGWMDVVNFQCRSLAYEGRVYVILIMKA
jgi:hypothetical protein